MKAQSFASAGTPRVFVIHENDAWVEPLRREFVMFEVPFCEWFLNEGMLDLTMAPPEGVFYNRMSASSHTRGHRYAPEFTAAVLAWLKHHGRIVVNGERALQLEVSKVAQYEALKAFGIATPDTIAVIGRDNIADAAKKISFPVILKHNRAGKGLGVRLLFSPAALAEQSLARAPRSHRAISFRSCPTSNIRWCQLGRRSLPRMTSALPGSNSSSTRLATPLPTTSTPTPTIIRTRKQRTAAVACARLLPISEAC